MVPEPLVLNANAPLIEPDTESEFAELLTQVWLAPRIRGALTVTAPAPAPTVMPLVPLAMMVSELAPPMLTGVDSAPIEVPSTVRLLTMKFWPSVLLRLPALALVV